MHESLGEIFYIGLGVAAVIAIILSHVKRYKIKLYLKVNYAETHLKIFINERCENLEDEEEELFSTFISHHYKQLNDKVLTAHIIQYKLSQLLFAFFSILFLSQKLPSTIFICNKYQAA